ncbi:MAG: hypothetical protein Ct9H300mP16_19370 [Pseudomonadota bacterium]|nr:MAG: hypothetical protein Ct9H300mP16_19370 [Pseudomonadota bacterium]
MDIDLEPQRSFFTESDRVRTRRLTIETTITVYFRVVFVKIAGSPGTECFLIRDTGEGETAGQFFPDAVEVTESEDRSRSAALHVRAAAAPDFAIGHFAGPRSVGPAIVVFVYRKAINMPIQNQMLSGIAPSKVPTTLAMSGCGSTSR